jgi:hypothetical protein
MSFKAEVGCPAEELSASEVARNWCVQPMAPK